MAPFNKLHRVINFGGKWNGQLIIDNGDVYDVDVHIIQYLDDIRVKVKTNNFYNDSLVCKMKTDSNGTYLYFVYKSKPNGKVDSINQIDFGTFIVRCDEDYLQGSYFTLSKVIGKVELYRK